MTNDEFLKALAAYRSIIKPQTYQSLTEAIKADRFKDEIKDALLDQMELSSQMLGALDAAQQEQARIYSDGIQKFEALKTNAQAQYQKAVKAAESESEREDRKKAEQLLTHNL